MKPAVAMAYRAELEKREAAAAKPPAAQPAAKKAAAQPAAAKKPAAADGALKLHLNRTGRLCFLKAATARLGDDWSGKHMAMAIERGIIRIDLAKPAADTLRVGDGAGRPYISAMKQFKGLGFDGSDSRDIEAKPYGKAGFEFRIGQ